MRLTRVLCRQHIDRMFKKHWRAKKSQIPIETGAETVLRDRGFPITDPLEMIKDKKLFEKIPDVIGIVPKPVPCDENHPLFNKRACYAYHDNSLLMEGFTQAQVLTNSVEIKQGLPVVIEDLIQSTAANMPENLDELVQRCIMNAHLFDAYQEKLPKIKDPERPAFNFPRVYGIPDYRRNRMITNNLLRLCGTLGQSASRLVVRDTPVRVYLERDNDLISWNVTPGVMLCGPSPLPHHVNKTGIQATEHLPLPDIFPLKSTISLQTTHFYEKGDLFPMQYTSAYPHVNTAIFHYNETMIANLHEEPVTQTQVLARTLTHTFAVALAVAKNRFGNLSADSVLPEPVTLQGIQTDGIQFHFVVLQLNNLASQGVKNVVWSSPLLSLFSSCEYSQGCPVLHKYNPEVFSNVLAFYNNGSSK